MIEAPNASNDAAVIEADTTNSPLTPVKRGRGRPKKLNVEPTIAHSKTPSAEVQPAEGQPVKKSTRKTTAKSAQKTALTTGNDNASVQEPSVTKPTTRRTRKTNTQAVAQETPTQLSIPLASDSAPDHAAVQAPAILSVTPVDAPVLSASFSTPQQRETLAPLLMREPVSVVSHESERASDVRENHEQFVSLVEFTSVEPEVEEELEEDAEAADLTSQIDTGVIIANAPYRQRTQRAGQSGQRQKNQRKPVGRGVESSENSGFVQVPGPGGIFAPASMVALMNDPMTLPAVSASVSLMVNEIRTTMLAKRVPAQVPAPIAPRVSERVLDSNGSPLAVSTPETSEQAAFVADTLHAAPLMESLAESEDESVIPTKRRRSRRGGRGRKRAGATQNAAELLADGAQPVVDSFAEFDTVGEVREDTVAAYSAQDTDSTLIEDFGAGEPSEINEQASAETPRKSSRSRSRRRGGAARKAALEAAKAEMLENGELASRDVDTEANANTDNMEQFDDDDNEKQARKTPLGNRKMLISVQPDAQVEVVLTEKGKVQEYYVEMVHQAKIRGNIYKGVVSNVDTNLQAAFVNYGKAKNGFLQIDEIHPEYWLTHHEAVKGQKYPPIQKVIKAGQEVLIQVVKEPTGNKGAFLTTWVSLAGRFLVLTPGQEQIGISRKVEDGEERNRLRELIKGIEPGPGLGAIVRTVSAGTSKTTLQKDLNFLKRVWKDIRKRATVEKAPCLIYEEPGLATRAVRDYLSDDVSEVWVDDAATTTAIDEMAGLLFPRKGDLVHLYEDNGQTLWEKFGIQKQLEEVHSREVILPSGGRLVFDQTEALMAIDINSGKTAGKSNFASMAHRTNMEAAEVIARQLRLRDIGGQVVIDFIEMRDPKHCHEVEKVLRAAMKNDRARHDVAKMSAFGLLEIVRQRTGSSAISITQEPCPHCNGTGVRRNMEWQALQILRELRRQLRLASLAGQTDYQFSTLPEVGVYLLNNKRDRLSDLEKEFGIHLDIRITGLSL